MNHIEPGPSHAWLAWIVEPGEDASGRACAVRRFLLVAAAAHGWLMAARATGPVLEGWLTPAAVVLTVAALVGLRPTFERAACLAAAAVGVSRVVAAFPDAYNHLVLEAFLLLAAAAVRRDRPGESVLFVATVRWAVVIVFAWTGLQKVLHGCWFGGEFLALAAATNPHFGDPLALVWPAEMTRLRALGPLQVGAGPFRPESLGVITLSNLVWLAELALPALLAHRRTRTIGVAGTLLFLVGVEIVAREVVFGVLFGGVIALAFGPPWILGAGVLVGGALAVAATAGAVLWPDMWLN